MKNKSAALAIMLFVLAQNVSAQWPMMDNYGMMGGFGAGFAMLFYAALASFIFSLIFWYTYRLVVPGKKR